VRRAIVAIALCCAGTAGAVQAQTPSLRVGAVRARYADSIIGNAVSVSPRLDWSGRRMSASLEGSFAQFGADGWAAQLGGDFGVSRRLGARTGLVGFTQASASTLSDGLWSGTALTSVLVGRSGSAVTAHLGLTGGGVRRVRGGSDLAWGAATALSWRTRAGLLGARVQRLTVGPDRFTDLGGSARFERGRVAFDLAAGARVFDAGSADASWQVRASAALRRAIALEAAVGGYPRSPEGFTRGLYLSVGLRLTRVSRAPRMLVERIGDGQVRVSMTVEHARTVDIAGEFNGWEPAPMRAGGGDRWIVVIPVGRGAHKFSILVNGERWTVPVGVPTMPDGFGGEVGVLLVS